MGHALKRKLKSLLSKSMRLNKLQIFLVPLVFLIYCLSFLSNAPIHRDDVIWTKVSREVAKLEYSSPFGEIASTGHLRHSILTPIINIPINIFKSDYKSIVLYMVFVQMFSIYLILYFSNKNLLPQSKNIAIENILIVAFILFRPTFLLGHVFKVWQLTYVIVTALAIVMSFKKISESSSTKSLYLSMGLCGIAMHFHLSALILWPFIWGAIGNRDFSKKQIINSLLIYFIFGNIVIFQSWLTFSLCILGALGAFLYRYILKYIRHLYIFIFVVFSMLFVVELVRGTGVSPITATLEQVPSSGLFFFEQISFYDFPIKLRWISFELILLFGFMVKEFFIEEQGLGKHLLFSTLVSLSILSFVAIVYDSKTNPHQWYLIITVFILYYIASNVLKLKNGKAVLILLICFSSSINLLLQNELLKSRSSHGFYMTTLGERIKLLDEFCMKNLNVVKVLSVPNSSIPWSFLINENECLDEYQKGKVIDAVVHERLFPWRQESLRLEPMFTKEIWFSGDIWINTKKKTFR